jgi:hypothetical protein
MRIVQHAKKMLKNEVKEKEIEWSMFDNKWARTTKEAIEVATNEKKNIKFCQEKDPFLNIFQLRELSLTYYICFSEFVTN